MLKLMHISDIHLGATFTSASFGDEFALRRQQEIKETFFKTLNYVNEQKIDYVIISGDLFDFENMKRSDVRNVFQALSNVKTQVLLIAGNHDPMTPDSFWKTLDVNDNVHIFGEDIEMIEFPKDNLAVYGHSWNRYVIDEPLFDTLTIKDKNKINLLIAHGDVFQSKSSYLPIDQKKLMKKGFDYVALGHIHKHEFLSDCIAYAGSLEPFDFSEPGVHGFIQIDLDKTSIETTFVPFAKREFIEKTIVLNGDMTEEDIRQRLINLDSSDNRQINMYRVNLTGRYAYDLNLDPNYLQSLVETDFAYIEFKQKAQPNFDINDLYKNNQHNIIGKFINHVRSKDIDDDKKEQLLNTGLELLLSSREGTL